MTDHEKQFSDHWVARIWPTIKDDFERLLKTTPKRIAERAEKDKKEAKKDKSEDQQKKDKKKLPPVQEKLARTIEETNEKGERRNVYLNMAWTGPIDNTFLDVGQGGELGCGHVPAERAYGRVGWNSERVSGGR